jgi:hypothetical protein
MMTVTPTERCAAVVCNPPTPATSQQNERLGFGVMSTTRYLLNNVNCASSFVHGSSN